MRAKHIIIGLITLALVVTAWKVSEENAPQTDVARGPLYPGLLERLNDVARIEIKSAKHALTLKREGETWNVANKDGYPATFAEIKRSILQVANLVTVEAKTTRPDNYAQLGVADIKNDKAEGTLVEAYGADEQRVFGLIVGKERSKANDQRYVRRIDEAQAWLVDGVLAVDADPIKWLDARLVDIDSNAVRQVTLTIPGEPAVVVSKAGRKDNFFALGNIPAGFVAKSKATVSSVGALLLDLRFNDVLAASKVANLTPLRQIEVQTFDGLVVNIDQHEVDGKTLSHFDFRFDAALVVAAEAPAKETSATPADAPTTSDAKAEPSAENTAETVVPEETKTDQPPAETAEQMASRLKTATANWVYVLPDYKLRMVNKKLADLIEKPEAETKQKPAG